MSHLFAPSDAECVCAIFMGLPTSRSKVLLLPPLVIGTLFSSDTIMANLTDRFLRVGSGYARIWHACVSVPLVTSRDNYARNGSCYIRFSIVKTFPKIIYLHNTFNSLATYTYS